MSVNIVPVTSKKLLKEYINFPHDLYRDDPCYVPELYMAQKEMFDRKKNPFLSTFASRIIPGQKKWKSCRTDICPSSTTTTISTTSAKLGFFGFFDTINDYTVAQSLLDQACSWVHSKGMDTIIGPENFSTNDTAGLLIDGFHEPPKIMMPYNKPYYQDLLEQYGFKKDIDLFAYILYTHKASEKSVRLAQALEERLRKQGITFRSITKKTLSKDVEAIRAIYNDAWAKNWGFVPMTDDELVHLANELKMILHPNWCFIAEDNGKPIGFSVSLHNIFEITKDFKNGRLFPFNIFKLLRKRHKTEYVRIITLGVNQEYRKKGIEAIFFAKNILEARRSNIVAGEVSWVLENNDEMNASAIKLNSELYKTYRIFRYDFDE